MIQVTAKVENIKGVEALMERLSKEFGPRSAQLTIRAAMRNTLKGVATDIKANTPVRTGKMRDSVRTRIVVPRNNQQGNKPAISGRIGYRISRRRATSDRFPSIGQVLGVEYGNNRNIRVGRKTIESVFNRHEPRLRATFIKTFVNEFEKRVKREARKQGLEYRRR